MFVSVFTALRISSRGAAVLYHGQSKADAEEVIYLDENDCRVPDQDLYYKWTLTETKVEEL